MRKAHQVVARGRAQLGAAHVEPEMAQVQVETVGAVCADGPELLREVTRLRQGAAREAAAEDCLLVASGVPPLGGSGPPPILDQPRYHEIARRFGPLVDDQCVSACHVHVGVPDREEAAQVVNHVRPWLPTLLALTTNSPFWRGADTGYASWRATLWGRWPTAGPPPYLESADHYESIVQTLVDSGAAMDPAMLYWWARPSRHVPTVEIRIADVLTTGTETVAYALTVRALVGVALEEVRQGRPGPQVPDTLLAAACWQAARRGLDGRSLIGPDAAVPANPHMSAWDAVRRLEKVIDPHLGSTDERSMVRGWLFDLKARGTGAHRQRAVHRHHQALPQVIDALSERLCTAVPQRADGPAHFRRDG